MRITLVLGLTGLMALAACGTSDRETDHVAACQEQADMARSGKVPTGEIAISCPDHGIGDFGH
jgi:hypothetical protein